MNRKISFILLALVFVSFSCKRVEKKADTTKPKKIETSKDDSTDQLVVATLWYQKAPERRALCYQAYNLAKMRIDDVVMDADNSKPACVVLDIDETVLDNSPFEGKCIETGKSYSKESWKAWSDLAQAEAIPGALDFCNYAKDKGVEVFYVTNRRSNEEEATLKNLVAHGFPNANADHLFLRTDESSKKARRAAIEKDYQIVLLLGDNLGDFSEIFEDRSSDYGFPTVDENRDQFGQRFVLLPNPMYGSWEQAVLNKKSGNKAQQRKAQVDAF